jgi:putative DNA primase/helicase
VIDAQQIACALRGDVVGRDQVLAPSPGHSAKDRSLSVKIAPNHPNGLVVHSFTEDWRTCRDYVFERLGIDRCRPGHKHPEPGVRPRVVDPERREPNKSALALWHGARSPRGTLAEKYLALRGLALPDGDALRFHPHCVFGRDQSGRWRYFPCLVGLYRDTVTDEPRAIHRTALLPDGRKFNRAALGPKAGCAIKLTPDEDVADGLVIGEGIETTLAGMMQTFRPAWALGDADEVAKLPVLAGIESLTILVDNDVSGKGQASAAECSMRWRAAGREVFRVLPDSLGEDMANCVRGRAA